MKRSSIVLVLAMMAAVSARGDMATGTINGPMELVGGTIYTIENNVTIQAGTGQSALTVKSGTGAAGKCVVIDIPAGKELNVTGGNASGRTGAGAGIALPADMTLYITGRGRLVAKGGKAANGGNGSGGGNADFDDDGTNHFKNGPGGAGGEGGGGAGAGIGGSGGSGASAGSGAAQSDWRYADHGKNFPADGSEGGSGGSGSNGNGCGRVLILGDVTVNVSGGASGAAGSASRSWGATKDDIKTDDWHAGGGGPGGGGGGGGEAMVRLVCRCRQLGNLLFDQNRRRTRW